MAVLIQRTPIYDDDGSGTTGTVFENAWKVELYDQIDAALAAGAVGSKNDAVGAREITLGNTDYPEISLADLPPVAVVKLQGHTIPIRIHSFSTNGAIRNGQLLTLVGGAAIPPIGLVHNSSTQSNAALRLINAATSGDTPIAGTGQATYVWSTAVNAWALVSHDQGTWITAPYNPGNFTASGGGGGTWTVEAGDVVSLTYRLTGRTLTVAVLLSATAVGGSPQLLEIQKAAWGGFTAARIVDTIALYDFQVALFEAHPARSSLIFLRSGNWTGGLSIAAQVLFDVS
jgi:hypothetical protein